MRHSAVFFAVLMAGLTGCGSSTEAEPQPEPTVAETSTAPEAEATVPALPSEQPLPEPEVYSPGEFEVTTSDGAIITMQIPSAPVADIEAFREAAGAEPVTYMTAQIDNRAGTETVSIYEVTLYDPDGNSYVFQDASVSFIGEWGPTFTSDYAYVLPDGTEVDETLGDELSRQETDLYNKYLESDSADPLERNDEVVMLGAFPEVPQEITGVAVLPYGGFGEPVMATPVE